MSIRASVRHKIVLRRSSRKNGSFIRRARQVCNSAAVPLFKQEVDNRFDIAARRLKSLVIKGSIRDRARLSSRNWSAIFDETVADDVPT